MGSAETVEFTGYAESVKTALDAVQAGEVLRGKTQILIKPNLINDSPPPITTSVRCCEAIIEYARLHTDARIVIAEGCGAPGMGTREVFERLGYQALARRKNIELVDLNNAKTICLKNPSLTAFPVIHLPEIVFSHFLISVPVLKAHSLADITGSLKNMIGLAPPKHYQRRGHWKKAAFHNDVQQAITDLNTYRAPDLTLMDASVGMAEYHLGGPHCDPPVRKLVAGTDAREVDRTAAELLGLDWHTIGHLC